MPATNPMRIVWDNAVDRGTLTSTSAAVTQLNLGTDSKSEVWRSVAAVTTASVSVSWTDLEPVSCIAFPFCNFSPTATMVVKCYSDTAGSTLTYTSATTLCSAASAVKVVGLTLTQSASAYNFGGGSTAVVYIPLISVRKITIDIVDTSNLQAYLEAARLVIGEYYAPCYGNEYGASVVNEDLSENYRSDAGNLHSDVGARFKKLSLNMGVLTETDRAGLWKVLSYCGVSTPMFVSMFPGHSDKNIEQAHTVYGKLSEVSAITALTYKLYSAPLDIEGI